MGIMTGTLCKDFCG